VVRSSKTSAFTFSGLPRKDAAVAAVLSASLITALFLTLGFPFIDNFINDFRRKPLRKGANARILEEIEEIQLRQKLSQANTALKVEEKKAANFGFADYRQSELDSAKADIEFAEQKIKDIEDRKKAFGNSLNVGNELMAVYQERDMARERMNKLRKAIESERVEKSKKQE